MTYYASEIAKYSLDYCNKNDSSVSNLKLQKMLYFLWVDYFKKTRCELFTDEICAWQLGPVVPNVYYEYCAYAGKPIRLFSQTDVIESDQNILSKIIDKYVNIPTSSLVNKTHQKDTPWSIVFRDGLGNRDVIPFDLIKKIECMV